VEPGDLVVRGQPDLQHRHVTLQVKHLVERRADVAFLDAGHRGGRKIDAADDDVTGRVAVGLQHVHQRGGDVAMLGADRLQIRVRFEIGRQNGRRQRDIRVDFLRDVERIHDHAGLFQRILDALRAAAAELFVPDVIHQRRVAGLQASSDHRLSGQIATLVQVRPGIAEALGLILRLEVGKRVVAAGDDNAAADRLIHQRRERVFTGVTHDGDAIRFRGQGFVELVDHGLLIPARVLLVQLDAQGFGSGDGAIRAGQRRAVALRAAHLHVDDKLIVLRDRPGRRYDREGHRDHGHNNDQTN